MSLRQECLEVIWESELKNFKFRDKVRISDSIANILNIGQLVIYIRLAGK